jgi:cytochrome P450 family 109
MTVANQALPALPGVWDPSRAPHTDETGAHNVYAYQHVLRVATDGEAFSADYGIRPEDYPHVHPMLIGLWTAGDPRHRDLRDAVDEPFHRGRTAELRPQLRGLADDLIDQVLARGDGRVELIAEIAKPFHLRATCGLLGLDPSHAPMFDDWIRTAAEAMAVNEIKPDPEQTKFWFRLIAERRAHPQTGLVDDLIAVQQRGDYLVAGQPMSEWDLVGYFAMLLAAGYEVISGLANTVLFAEEFGVLDALYADNRLLAGALEESLRRYPPFVTTQRTATADVDFDGYTVKPGDRVVGWITAANRDPNWFPDPDAYDIRRDPNPPHLAFGWGPRYCLGAPMARLEMLVGLEVILERLPGLRRDRTQPLTRTYGIVHPLDKLPCTIETPIHR